MQVIVDSDFNNNKKKCLTKPIQYLMPIIFPRNLICISSNFFYTHNEYVENLQRSFPVNHKK